jgi:DNA-binding transcriptional ArsR family regulator
MMPTHARGHPPAAARSEIDDMIMTLLVKEPDGVTFTWLVRAAAKKGIGKQTVWRHLDDLVDGGLVTHPKDSRRMLYYPSKMVLGVRGPGPFKIEVGTYDIGETGLRPGTNPLGSEEGLRMVLVEKFRIVLQTYLNLLHVVTGIKSEADAEAILTFSVRHEIDGELLRLAREVWLEKKSVPLKALSGKQLPEFLIRYSDKK